MLIYFTKDYVLGIEDVVVPLEQMIGRKVGARIVEPHPVGVVGLPAVGDTTTAELGTGLAAGHGAGTGAGWNVRELPKPRVTGPLPGHVGLTGTSGSLILVGTGGGDPDRIIKVVQAEITGSLPGANVPDSNVQADLRVSVPPPPVRNRSLTSDDPAVAVDH